MIFENVRDALAQQFEVDPDSITMDTNLIDDLGADSLDVVELIMSLEDSFVGEGVTDFKSTRRSGILRDGHRNFQIIGQIARQVDTHPCLLRTERQEGQERDKKKKQFFHLVFQSYLGIWAP